MPQKKLFITDQRMLELMEWAINTGVVQHQSEWCDKIAFGRTNLRAVKIGEQSFTKEHILRACELTGVTPNWFFGMDGNKFGGKQKELTAIQQLKVAVNLVEQELKNKKK
jgi:hypothetical protein